MPTPPLDKRLDALMASAPGADPVYVEATGWLGGTSPAALNSIYRDFQRKFQEQEGALVKLLGRPARRLPADRDWFDAWYPECLHAAAWERGDKVVCLAVEHHDRETPVGLVLRCVTRGEIEEL